MTIPFLLRRTGWAGALALTALLGTAGAGSAASYIVQNIGSSGGGSLRAALASATGDGDPSDTITFASGVTGTISTGGTELAIGKSMTITGPGTGTLTISAGNAGRVFHITAGTVAISGLSIANGRVSNDEGGGILNSGTLTVTGCALSGNVSSGSADGGAISNEGTLTVASSAFSSNSSTDGGGIYNGAGTVSLTGCLFAGNTAAAYGGALFFNGTTTVTNCTFSGNTANSWAGGILVTGTCAVTSCTFSGNVSNTPYSAGFIFGGMGGGGGIFCQQGSLSVKASLFTASIHGDINGSGSPIGTITSGGSNLLGDGNGNGFTNGTNHDQTGVANPMLGALAANGGPTQTYALLAGSPAIDADYSSSTAQDQRGYARPFGVRNDIGAYEAGASPAGPTLTSISVTAASASVAAGRTDQFTATAHYSDSSTADVTGTATWASSNTSKATISSTGLATGVAVGTANITASLGGVTSNSVTLNVTPAVIASITITAASASVAKGRTDQFTATATYSDGTTANVTHGDGSTWVSDTPAVATISSAGLATGAAVGTAHITASFGGVTSNSITLTITPAVVSSISVTAASASVTVGGTDQFTATATYSDGTTADVTGTATWASDSMATATVNAAGLATGVGVGTAHITATLGGVTSSPVTLTVTHAPATLVVTNNLDDGSAGCLRSVLASAAPGDTVTFASNVTGTITLAGNEIGLFFGQDVTIVGPGADVLAITGSHANRIFEIEASTVAISGLTIENGSDSGSGGGLYNGGGTVTVTACAFLNDAAGSDGGGLYNDGGGTVAVIGCTFSGSTAGGSGGGLCSDGTATVTDSTFSGNTGTYGGGLVNSGTLTITGCTFSGNTGSSSGGGIYNTGSLALTADLFAGNVGGDLVRGIRRGGGITTVTSGGSNLLGDASPSAFSTPGAHDQFGVTTAQALLGPLAANGGPTQTCAVLAGSPAIGGDYSGATATDQRGVVRASHTIGAFEYVAPTLAPIRTHVLWNNSDGRVMLWNVDALGQDTYHVFGPYTDGAPQNQWSATALATGPDGMNHILWNNSDGRVMLWTVDNDGSFTLAGYGPYTDDSVGNDPSVNHWHATAVSVGPDNITHLLWNNTDHRVMLWNVDSAFHFTLAGYGPYTDNLVSSDPGNLWSATALATGPDNVSRIAWNNSDGRVMLWNVDSAFSFTLAGYGPYTDDSVGSDPSVNLWSAKGVSVGPDNLTHLLWANTDRRMMLWNVDGSFNFALAGFGPYTDNTVGTDPSVNLWTATALATGPDNLSRVLWANTDYRMMLWDVGSVFNFTLAGYGPYTDILTGGATGGQWSATAVSAAP